MYGRWAIAISKTHFRRPGRHPLGSSARVRPTRLVKTAFAASGNGQHDCCGAASCLIKRHPNTSDRRDADPRDRRCRTMMKLIRRLISSKAGVVVTLILLVLIALAFGLSDVAI